MTEHKSRTELRAEVIALRADKKSLQAEIRLLRRSKIAEGLFSVLRETVKYTGLVGISLCLYKSILALSGETTNANLSLIADLKIRGATINNFFYVLLTCSGWLYGFIQKKLKNRTIGRLEGRIVQFEKSIDKGRTSSKLTCHGETRPEDR